MAGGEATFLKQILDRRFELQKANGVGDGGAVFSGAFRDLLLGEMKLIDQALERVGLLDGVEVLTLEIFDQCHFKRELFGDVAQNRRNAA